MNEQFTHELIEHARKFGYNDIRVGAPERKSEDAEGSAGDEDDELRDAKFEPAQYEQSADGKESVRKQRRQRQGGRDQRATASSEGDSDNKRQDLRVLARELALLKRGKRSTDSPVVVGRSGIAGLDGKSVA
mmetsp:Transcript_23760/g.31806  ORF Transcript_23760/g.31806 Transcript_23760/m.31806 type:complete len:132 (-) Transcript_23760:2799-3194(-)